MNKMMKCIGFLCILIVPIVSCLNAQSLGQILDKHFEATGIENLKKVHSVKYSGMYKNHFLKKISPDIPEELFNVDIELTVARNKSYLLKIISEQGTNIYGFSSDGYWNGQMGGTLAKWSPIDVDRIFIQLKIDFDGFLFNSQDKSIQLHKLDDVNHKRNTYYRIMAITPDKDTLFYYINQKNYLVEKISFEEEIKDDEQQTYIEFSDFKNVEGVQIACRLIYNIKMLDGSFGKREEILKRIEFNPNIDSSIFEYESYLNQ